MLDGVDAPFRERAVVGPAGDVDIDMSTAPVAEAHRHLRWFANHCHVRGDPLLHQLGSPLIHVLLVRHKGQQQVPRKIAALSLIHILFLPDCHESLAGIVAGRIRERYCKPTLILTRSEDGAKGSGRSIEAYHMFNALVEVKDLLTKFGGHPMAAGFSLPEDKVDEFRRRLNENAKLTEEDFIPKIWIDVAMPFEYINESLIEELELLEPFGQGNEKPQFAQKLSLIHIYPILKSVLKIACPTGVKLSVLEAEKAAANLVSGKYGRERITIVTKTPQCLCDLIRGGYELEADITVGNMSNGADKKLSLIHI